MEKSLTVTYRLKITLSKNPNPTKIFDRFFFFYFSSLSLSLCGRRWRSILPSISCNRVSQYLLWNRRITRRDCRAVVVFFYYCLGWVVFSDVSVRRRIADAASRAVIEPAPSGRYGSYCFFWTFFPFEYCARGRSVELFIYFWLCKVIRWFFWCLLANEFQRLYFLVFLIVFVLWILEVVDSLDWCLEARRFSVIWLDEFLIVFVLSWWYEF